MRRPMKIRILGIAALLTSLPLLGIAESARPRLSDDEFHCGTSPERTRQVYANGLYHEDRLRILKRNRQYLPAASPGLVAISKDVGDVAVIEDDGSLVAEPSPFDLASRAIRFEPTGSTTYRVLLSTTAFNTAGGTTVPLGDDASALQNLGEFNFTFFGKSYSSVYVNSDGNLTFVEPESSSLDRDLGRFSAGPPRIGAFFADLDPSQSGTVSYRRDTDGLQISWELVPEFSSSGATRLNSFSIKLYKSGIIEYIYSGRMDSVEAVVGISPGYGRTGFSAVNYLADSPTQTLSGTISHVYSSTRKISELAIAQKFFETHPDTFDHLTLFLGFEYNMGSSYAYEVNVKNEILGIGQPVEDYSELFGSRGRLRSFLNMGPLSTRFRPYPDDPNQVFFGTNSTMGIMGQESGHRWLAFTPFRDGNFNSQAILGRDNAHWSFFYNSFGSVMEGNEIIDRGADRGVDRFITTKATYTFSPLDQYIMGLRGKEEVPPSFLVENPVGTSQGAASNPAINIVFGGTRKDIGVDRIVEANGPRIPSVTRAPKVFHQGFIYLTLKGTTAPADQIQKVQKIRDAWVSFFHEQTSGRGWITTNLQETPDTTPSEIVFPYFQGNNQRYTGIALANFGAAPADILFTAIGNDGLQVHEPSAMLNPRIMTIGPGAQIALLAEQIFGLSFSDPRNGWIRAESATSSVRGFFLDGDQAQTFLTGAVADSRAVRRLFFLRAQLSSAPSPGNTYRNLINIVNPNAVESQVSLELCDETGKPLDVARRTLPARGRLATDLPELFPAAGAARSQGYIVVTSSVGVIGYQSIDTGSTIFSLPGIPEGSAAKLYSAQFASGVVGGIRYFSDLNFINTSGQSRAFQVQLVGNDGQPFAGISNPVIRNLGPGEQLRIRGELFFGLPDAAAASSLVEGSLVVAADGPGLIGDVTFGDPQTGRFIASLPLDGNPVSNFLFSQVAQGKAGGSKDYFTGIAMYNPGAADVDVSLEVFSESGAKTGSAAFKLGKGMRISKTLPQYVPALAEQARGFIRIGTVGGPVVAFELFGGQSLEFLAAVPPQPVSP